MQFAPKIIEKVLILFMMMIPGIIVGIVGILLGLGIIPVFKGLK